MSTARDIASLLGTDGTFSSSRYGDSGITSAKIADDAITATKTDLSLVAGDTIHGTGVDTWARLPKGTDGQVYTLESGLPSWATAATPAGVPTGSMIDFGGAAAPSGWALCDGTTGINSVTDTTFADLFAVIGTTFGGTGASDFDLPDLRGRVTIGLDNLGGTSSNRMTDANADTLGGAGGSETNVLTSANMPAHTHTGPSHTHNGTNHTHTGPSHTHGLDIYVGTGGGAVRPYNRTGDNTNFGTGLNSLAGGTGATGAGGAGATSASGTGATGSTGSGTAHRIDQPWMALTKIIKK